MLTATNYKYKNFISSKVACFISVDPLQFKYAYYTLSSDEAVKINKENTKAFGLGFCLSRSILQAVPVTDVTSINNSIY